MDRLDAFTRAYIEAALWASTDDKDEHLDAYYDVSDLAPETLSTVIEECRAFRETAGDLLDGADDEQAGHDFWLTRNGHGAGFWDRGEGAYPNDKRGARLTELAHAYGEVYWYVGDDGQVYQG